MEKDNMVPKVRSIVEMDNVDLLISKALKVLSQNSYITDVRLTNKQGEGLHITRAILPQVNQTVLVQLPK